MATHNLGIGAVLDLLRTGGRATRAAWPADQWLVLVPGSVIEVQHGRPMGAALPERLGQRVEYRTHLDLVLADGTVHSWAPTHADLLAEDWIGCVRGAKHLARDGASA